MSTGFQLAKVNAEQPPHLLDGASQGTCQAGGHLLGRRLQLDGGGRPRLTRTGRSISIQARQFSGRQRPLQAFRERERLPAGAALDHR